MKILKSVLDSSVNFVLDNGVECRFVQRTDDYFIIYVSSHNGCNKACRFCHLTQTGQTDYESVTYSQYLHQVQIVLEYWNENIKPIAPKPCKVHVNFMARGEPLDNPVVRNNWAALSTEIRDMIRQVVGTDLVKFKISTIIPESLEYPTALINNFKKGIYPEIYYSMYSVNPDFRKRWIPKSMSLEKSLPLIKIFMGEGIKVTFHHALIKGQNATLVDAKEFVKTLEKYDIVNAKFNLVRYNPYGVAQGIEPNDRVIMNYLSVINDCGLFSCVKVIPKVGFDVQASCGMFVAKELVRV
jgi:23S rRNA (adenine2503-C2)-methyltransferase